MAERSKPLNIRLSVSDQETVSRALKNLGAEGEAALKKLEKASDAAAKRMQSHRGVAQGLSLEFQNMAARAGPLAPILMSMGPAGTAAAASIAVLTVGLKAAIGQAAEAELANVRLGAVLRATGDAAGLTRKQLVSFADEIQRSFGVSDEAVISVEQRLIQLGVTGETIKRTITAALDLAAAGIGTFESNAESLARAFAKPEMAGRKLLGLNINLSETQRELIKTFADTGDAAGAADVILKQIAATVGGSAQAEAGTLTGRTRSLGTAWDEMLEAIGKTPLVASLAEGALIRLQQITKSLTDPETSIASQIAAVEQQIAELKKLPSGFDFQKNITNSRIKDLEQQRQILAASLAIEEIEQQTSKLKAARAAEQSKADAQELKNADAKEKAAQESIRIAERKAEQQKQASENIKDQIAGLKTETANMKLADKERAIAVELQKAENTARKAEIKLLPEQIRAIRELSGAIFDEGVAREKASEEAERQREAAQKQIEEAKRQAEERQQIWRHAAENIQDALAGSIRDSFDSNSEGFVKSFFRRIVDLAKDAAAQIAAAMIINPVFGAIGFPGFGGGAGGVGGAAGSIGGGLLGNLGSSILGQALKSPLASLGSFLFGKAAITLPAGVAGPVAPATAGVLGSGGTLFGSSFLAGAAPLALGATALFGLSKIFGGKKSVGPGAGAILNVGPEGFSLGRTSTDNGGNASGISVIVRDAAEALNTLLKIPGVTAGMAKEGGGLFPWLGNPAPTWASYIDTFGSRGINTAEDMVREAISRSTIVGLAEADKKMLLGASNLGQAITDLVNSKTGEDGAGQIAVEAARGKLVEAYQRESAALKDVIERFGAFGKSLRDFKQTLTIGDLANLSPEARLAETKKLFGDVSARAKLGDADAMQQITQVGADYAAQLRDFFGSTADYTRGLNEITAAVDAAIATADRRVSVASGELTAMQSSVDGLITVNESVLSVRDAIKQLQDAILKAAPPVPASSASTMAAVSSITTTGGVDSGPATWPLPKAIPIGLPATGASSPATSILSPSAGKDFIMAWGKGGFYKRYLADGGIGRGLTVVGERGPELVDFASPARVYPASQTSMMLNNNDQYTELKAQTAELKALVKVQQFVGRAMLDELARLRGASEAGARLTQRSAA